MDDNPETIKVLNEIVDAVRRINDPIKTQLLKEHRSEYKSLINFLLSLSIGGFTFLISFQHNFTNKNANYSYLFLAALVGLTLSSAFGLFLRDQIMKSPLRESNQTKPPIQPNHEDRLKYKTIDRVPSLKEQWLYKLQIWSFGLSFLVLLVYVFINT